MGPTMRSYQQFCPAARALDVIGERWTLLVIRELLAGQKRYTDLQDGLPGIGPNVLADRLRSLQQAGLVEKKRLPPRKAKPRRRCRSPPSPKARSIEWLRPTPFSGPFTRRA